MNATLREKEKDRDGITRSGLAPAFGKKGRETDNRIPNAVNAMDEANGFLVRKLLRGKGEPGSTIALEGLKTSFTQDTLCIIDH